MEFTINDAQKALKRTLSISRRSNKQISFAIQSQRVRGDTTHINVVILELLRAIQATFPELNVIFTDPDANRDNH